jgi:hypothetical protein
MMALVATVRWTVAVAPQPCLVSRKPRTPSAPRVVSHYNQPFTLIGYSRTHHNDISFASEFRRQTKGPAGCLRAAGCLSVPFVEASAGPRPIRRGRNMKESESRGRHTQAAPRPIRCLNGSSAADGYPSHTSPPYLILSIALSVFSLTSSPGGKNRRDAGGCAAGGGL